MEPNERTPAEPPAAGLDPAADAAGGPGYAHTQRAPLHLLLYPPAALLMALGWICRGEPIVLYTQLAAAAALLLTSFMFQHLTVRDAGERLVLRYGPLPVFGCKIRYADITAAEPSQSAWIDGWGIHWIPGRGTTYNLWGFACVKLEVRGKVIRIGTDDVERLTSFLGNKIQAGR